MDRRIVFTYFIIFLCIIQCDYSLITKILNRSECDYTTIKFKNGSEIQSIDESKDSKRGYIRGRRLTDEEYQRMIYCEQVKAEEKLDEILKFLGLK